MNNDAGVKGNAGARSMAESRKQQRPEWDVHWTRSNRKATQSPDVVVHHVAIGTVEALIGIVALTIVGFVVPGHWGLLDIQPHPLWIVVIAIAVRYGAASGYIAGAVSAASYTLFLCVDPHLGLHPPGTQQMIQPFLLLAGGIVVGELTRSQHRRLVTVQQFYQQASKASHALAQQQQALAETNAELERRIMNQSSSLLTLHRVARTLNVLHVEAIYPAILDVVSHVLEAESCALYLWRDGQLQLHNDRPTSRFPPRPLVWNATTGVIGRAVRENRIVTIHDRLMDEDSQVVADEPAMMAGPLVGRDTQILGIVVVEHLPFEKLNRASIRTFQILLDWSSAALANARVVEELQQNAVGGHSSGRDPTLSLASASAHAQAEQDKLDTVPRETQHPGRM